MECQLRYAYLGGTELSSADLKNARFGDNGGISEEIKLNLIQRGAIFEDSPENP
ncbi:MAG: pentapeptide repeat-containing protein [Nostocaceae cyanobacterium]|nr:pentapeptide repeat-containing protein [Nostocaceae cyanobacterium]